MKLFSRSGDVVEKTLATMLKATEHASVADALSDTAGLLQRIDPRVKLPGLFLLVLAVASSRHLTVIAVIFVAAILLAAFSKISALRLAVWVWLPVLLFTGTIAAPALFLTPG
jgi:energy-coupling factor transporter transmembrane protein EcfT